MISPIIFAIVVTLNCVYTADLPYYITACRLTDTNLNECATKHANDAIEVLLMGDPAFKIPNLMPLQIKEVTAQTGENLRLTLKDAEISGLDSAKIELKIVNNGLKWSATVLFDMVQINGKYSIEGKIMVLPIRGEGDCEIRLEKLKVNYDIEFERVDRGGENYLERKSSSLTHSTDRTYYKFENLFNGDERLGEEMNKFIDDNWKDLAKELGPTSDAIVKRLIDRIIDAYTSTIPEDKILLMD